MDFLKLYILSLTTLLVSCANVSYHLVSVASVEQQALFDPAQTYSYYDEIVSGEVTFENFELLLRPYNSITTKRDLELLFVPVEEQGPFLGSVGKSPFLISVRLKGTKNTINFHPFKSKVNETVIVDKVKWKDPEPKCGNYYTDWDNLRVDHTYIIPDRLRNVDKDCYKQGWIEYLLVFDMKTINPSEQFSLDLLFSNFETNTEITKRVYFNGAKFISTVTH
jgi:hypothetical protein